MLRLKPREEPFAAEIAGALLPASHPGHEHVRAMILDHAMATLWLLVRLDTTEAQVHAARRNLRPDRSWTEALVALRNHEVREYNRSPQMLWPPLRVFEIAEACSLLDDRLTVANVGERTWRRAVKRAEKATGRKVPRAKRTSRP